MSGDRTLYHLQCLPQAMWQEMGEAGPHGMRDLSMPDRVWPKLQWWRNGGKPARLHVFRQPV